MTLRLVQTELSEVRGTLPGLEALPEGHRYSYDVGIFPLGFEDRVWAAARALRLSGSVLGVCLVPTYSTNRADNERQWPVLREELRTLSGSEPKALSAGDRIATEVGEYLSGKSGASVMFDISGASNPLILRLMWTLFQTDVDLTIVYSEALEYRPNEEAYRRAKTGRCLEELELASGTGALESAVEMPGELDESARDCLVIIPSFDQDRARKVISFVDPTLLVTGSHQVHWLIGKPHLERDAWRAELLRELHGVGAGRFWAQYREVSTFNYLDTWTTLDQIYSERFPLDRFTLSPMGSKLQALGCAFFCESRPDVRVVFASPQQYRADAYTSGVRTTWRLHLGSTAALQSAAASVGELSVLGSSGEHVLRGVERVKW